MIHAHPFMPLPGTPWAAAPVREPAPRVRRALSELAARARAKGLSLAESSATWTDPETGTPGSAPLADIREIRFRNTTKRAAKIGGGWGFLAGMVFGAVYGMSQGNDPPEECAQIFGCESAGDKARMNALLFAPLGWLVGTAAGSPGRSTTSISSNRSGRAVWSSGQSPIQCDLGLKASPSGRLGKPLHDPPTACYTGF